MATTPSIAMIPSGYKDEKVYSVLPTNGDGDFTFARTSTATRVNSNGLIEEVGINKPRLDYSDGACPSLLLEPTSTNKIQYSEDFSNAYWAKSGSSVAGGFVSPSGDTSAFKLVESASNGEHFVKHTSLTVADDKYSFTIFAKAGGNSKLRVRGENFFDNVTGADFDLTAKTATNLSEGVNAKIVEISNGWFKCTFTSLSNGIVGNSGHFGIYLLDDNGDVSWLGDGTNGVYIYGAQLEQQSYATSYIKTEGTVITRSADSATGSGDSTVINSTQGVLYFEGSALADEVLDRRISLSDGTLNNYVSIGYSRFTGKIIGEVVSGGVTQTTNWGAQGITQANNNKFALYNRFIRCRINNFNNNITRLIITLV